VVVDVPAADVSAVFLLQHVHLAACEAAEEDAEFRVPKIDEEDVSGVLCVEIGLPEDAVVEGNGGRLVQQPRDSQLGYPGRVEEGSPFLLGEVGWNRHHCSFAVEVVLVHYQL